MSKKVTLQAVGPKVIVRPLKEEEKTESGIILPENSGKEKNMGEIVAIGKLTEQYKDLEVGDTVLFSEYGYDKIEYEGEEYFVMPDNKILAKVAK